MLNKSLSIKDNNITDERISRATDNDLCSDEVNQSSIVSNSNFSLINNLKKTAEEQLARLLKQGLTMSSMKSNLDILMKRYSNTKSYFSLFADWYGEMPWWCKLLLGLVVIGAGAGIGAIFNFPIVIACVVAGIYLITSGLLINHYTITEISNQRICEDIINMEKSLSFSIKNLSALEESLNTIMVAICNLNGQMANDILQFDFQMNELSKSIENYQQIIRSIETKKRSFEGHSSQIQTSLADVKTQLDTAHNILSEESIVFSNLNHEMTLTNDSLLSDSGKLNLICENFHDTTSNLSATIIKFQDMITIFGKNLNENREASHLVTNQRCENVMSDVDRTITKAASCIDSYDQIINLGRATELREKIRKAHEESKLCYERASSLLKNKNNHRKSNLILSDMP